ncbi:hypothetical protein XO10_07355 [Marinitoga sp. 1135]|uniref:hypothetical protein n=1 Tax=Marinitoga sp. 1135 TaxID=1643333 RepID=UPI001585EB2E|nr:hypothetical protein [Marinitoga sp. 1135]NUU96091.1 hypothetical protein [Marinitoga sp. 1135]
MSKKVIFFVILITGLLIFVSCMKSEKSNSLPTTTESSTQNKITDDSSTNIKPAPVPEKIKLKEWNYNLKISSSLQEKTFTVYSANITPKVQKFRFSPQLFSDNIPRLMIIKDKEIDMINLKSNKSEKIPEDFFDMPVTPMDNLIYFQNTDELLQKSGRYSLKTTLNENIYERFDKEKNLSEKIIVDRKYHTINKIILIRSVKTKEIIKKYNISKEYSDKNNLDNPVDIKTEMDFKYETIKNIKLPKTITITYKIQDREFSNTLSFETKDLVIEKVGDNK